MSETITLKRSGMRDLRFQGEQIAFVSDRESQGPKQNRYTELTLYRTTKDQYVLRIEARTHWQGEHNSDYTYVLHNESELLDHFLRENGAIDDLDKQLLEAAGIEVPPEEI